MSLKAQNVTLWLCCVSGKNVKSVHVGRAACGSPLSPAGGLGPYLFLLRHLALCGSQMLTVSNRNGGSSAPCAFLVSPCILWCSAVRHTLLSDCLSSPPRTLSLYHHTTLLFIPDNFPACSGIYTSFLGWPLADASSTFHPLWICFQSLAWGKLVTW